ncbi:MAG: hypothetical protein JSS66_06400 [Armatimonadetes bacterium]|nr:hypothetical protein [Armatimonadota bacterium]
MSLYNMMHGFNPLTPILAHILGLSIAENQPGTPVGRFRDIELNADGTQIHLLTRNGGGNREHWSFSYETEEGPECPCPGCIQEYVLPKHPQYVSDSDDDFDSTFAITVFNVPVEFLEQTRSWASGQEPQSLQEKTMNACERIGSMTAEELAADPQLGGLVQQLKTAVGGFQSEPGDEA